MTVTVAALPFALTASDPNAWSVDEQAGEITVTAPARTDLYVNPGGTDAGDAESLANAVTLLGVPPAGDFQFSSRVTVDFAARFDAGVLFLRVDEARWAKLCFELSPAAEPMVVSVVTRGVADDANAFTVAGRSVGLRVSRTGNVYAYHASLDGRLWRLIRVFSLGGDVATHRIGFEAQSPAGDGCRVTFGDLAFTSQRLLDLRDGT